MKSPRSMLMGLALVCAVFLGAVLPAAAGEPPPPGTEAPVAGGTAVPAPIQDAIEGVVDEDDATRKAALARLERATDADLPVLEKYADNADPEIRKQVGLILKRLKRGELVLKMGFGDGTAAAGGKFSVKLYAGEIQIYNNGGKQAVNLMNNQGMPAKEVFGVEATADAEGRIVVGKFNDGEYNYVVEAQEPLPRQTLAGKVTLRQDLAPLSLGIKKGVTTRVTVTDEKGEPVNEALVYVIEDGNFIRQIMQQPMVHMQAYLRQYTGGTTDEKGIATLEKAPLNELNVFVLKSGFDLLFKEKVAAEDGATVEVKVTLVKAKPVAVKMTVRDRSNKVLPGARILLVKQADIVKSLGADWNTTLDAGKIDEYIKQGATDLGTLDEKSGMATQVAPDPYMVAVFAKDGAAMFGNLIVNPSAKEFNVTVRCNPVVKPKPDNP